MNLDEIDKKCFILALFIRDDGQRFLLGSGAYEFKDSQLHFSANTMSNDIVEVQGNDGYLLAGQVRRPTTQVFDGYIGDASINKSDIEGYRRDFFAFFQKNHFYTVVYIFPDGTSIQRRRGFIVDAGEIRELYQMFPEYHIGLNFEDVNYYKYAEDEDGHEQYAKSIDINISKAVSGGLIWDSVSQEQAYNHGTDFSINGTIEDEPVDYIDLYGDTEQTTYSGKNLYEGSPSFDSFSGISAWEDGGTYNGMPVIKRAAAWTGAYRLINIEAGVTYTFSAWVKSDEARSVAIYAIGSGATATITPNNKNITTTTSWERVSFTFTCSTSGTVALRFENTSASTTNYTYISGYQLEKNSSVTSYEPYVGGTASPNPDYPQEVQTVTGRQVVTISDSDSQSQEYEINLGKNLFDTERAVTKFENSAGATVVSWGSYSDGVVTITRSNGAYGPTLFAGFIPKLIEGETYTLSATVRLSGTATGTGLRIGTNDTTPVYITLASKDTWIDASFTFTATAQVAADPRICINANNTGNIVEIKNIQLEKGSTATTYASYFTPIELCKIGDYQDYIYSVNGDYYLHKEIGKKVLDGSIAPDMVNSQQTNTTLADWYNFVPEATGAEARGGFSNYMSFNDTVWSSDVEGFCYSITNEAFYFRLNKTIIGTTTSSVQTWLQSHPTNFYYIIKATDTQITDATLIAQLEALNSATTYSGVTWFKTESEYLPADTWAYVQIQAGGGVVWDNYGATWEEGGGGMVVNVNVDSIENVYPVWTVNGPTDTPILTNLTTGTSITYNGNITASQTLVVDMLNQTALLNGTSVIGKLSGDWIELAPGMNRMSYTATNEQTAPKSTLEWQEIVG